MSADVETTNPFPKALRLHRGERLERKPAVVRNGVDGREPLLARGFPGVRKLQAQSIPHGVVADYMIDVIREHVLKGSGNSPFVSFSANRKVAERFAGNPHRGFVMSVVVRIVREYAVQAYPEAQYGSFTDDRERFWIWTAGCNVGTDAITDPALVKKFQAYGAGDAEYLLLGHIHPTELSLL